MESSGFLPIHSPGLRGYHGGPAPVFPPLATDLLSQGLLVTSRRGPASFLVKNKMFSFFDQLLAAPAFSFVLLASVNCYGIGNFHEVVVHRGICDASGVVDLQQGRFAVADDELNLLLVYEANGSGEAIYKTKIRGSWMWSKSPKKRAKN